MSNRDSKFDATRDFLENFADSVSPSFSEVDVGGDFKDYVDSNGDRVIEHTPSGQTFTLQSDGTLVSSSLSTDETNTERWAKPGEVQTVMDEVTAAGGGLVKLHPQRTYDPSSTWVVPGDVTLDFNDAHVDLSTDITAVEIKPPFGKIRDVSIDVSGLGYTSEAILIEPDTGDPHHSRTYTPVDGGKVAGDIGSGTGIRLHAKEQKIAHLTIRLDIHQIGTCCEIEFGNTWANGCQFYGSWKDAYNFAHIHKTGSEPSEPIAHRFYGYWQTNAGDSQRGLWVEDGSNNQFHGHIWDAGNFSEGIIVVGPDGGDGNIYATASIIDVADLVVDDSGSNENGIVAPYMTAISDSNNTVHGNETAAPATGVSIFGDVAEARGDYASAFGHNASARGTDSTALGVDSVARVDSLAAGARSETMGAWANALGPDAQALAGSSVALGSRVSVETTHLARIGGNNEFPSPRQVALAAIDGGSELADGDMLDQELTFAPDQANSKIGLKWKDTNGTVQTTEVGYDVVEGTVSVNSGGSAVAETFATGDRLQVFWGIDADPNAAVSIQERREYDDTNEEVDVVFDETSDAGAVDVTYEIRTM